MKILNAINLFFGYAFFGFGVVMLLTPDTQEFRLQGAILLTMGSVYLAIYRSILK